MTKVDLATKSSWRHNKPTGEQYRIWRRERKKGQQNKWECNTFERYQAILAACSVGRRLIVSEYVAIGVQLTCVSPF
mgnify:CR=1 FL=1